VRGPLLPAHGPTHDLFGYREFQLFCKYSASAVQYLCTASMSRISIVFPKDLLDIQTSYSVSHGKLRQIQKRQLTRLGLNEIIPLVTAANLLTGSEMSISLNLKIGTPDCFRIVRILQIPTQNRRYDGTRCPSSLFQVQRR
jgi:hypothetical protein